MKNLKNLKKQLLSSYESTLAVEGREICKEVESLIKDDHELLTEKANAYCLFCTDPKRADIDEKIVEKCRKIFKGYFKL